MVLINNSVDPRQFGEVNGIGQTGVALVRALGPAIGGMDKKEKNKKRRRRK